MTDLLVEVRRGAVIESIHRVHLVVCHASNGAARSGAASARRGAASARRGGAPARGSGALAPPAVIVTSAGDPELVTFVRSSIKMFQVLPFVEDGGVERYGLTPQELAVGTASHGGEPFHVAATRSILHKAEVPESALACGPHPPMHPGSAEVLVEAGAPPARIHNNCSGKHSGMLAMAKLHGWPLEGYHTLAHPVQQRIVKTLSHWTGVAADRTGVAIDGCGLPTFALPLRAVAQACARFATSDGAPARILSAMTTHPEYVAGTDRLDTDLMRATQGRVFAKVGAEGYYCAGAPSAGLGLALKVEDGAKRASEPALLATLRALDLITDAELDTLARYAHPAVRNTRGERVGEVRVRLALGV